MWSALRVFSILDLFGLVMPYLQVFLVASWMVELESYALDRVRAAILQLRRLPLRACQGHCVLFEKFVAPVTACWIPERHRSQVKPFGGRMSGFRQISRA